MKATILQQYKGSLDWELRRFGYAVNQVEEGKPLIEFEGDSVYATTDKEAVRAHVYRAAKALWGLQTCPLSSRDLMQILKGAA